jgi:hypothetical protein
MEDSFYYASYDTALTVRMCHFGIAVMLGGVPCSNLRWKFGDSYIFQGASLIIAVNSCGGILETSYCQFLPYLSIYLSVNLPIYLPTYLPVYLSIYLPIYLSICLSIYQSTYLSICPSIFLPVYLPIYLPTYLPVYLSIYLSAYISIHLSIYLTVYLSIYGSTSLCWALTAFSVSWSFTESVRLLATGISPSAKRTAQTE